MCERVEQLLAADHLAKRALSHQIDDVVVLHEEPCTVRGTPQYVSRPSSAGAAGLVLQPYASSRKLAATNPLITRPTTFKEPGEPIASFKDACQPGWTSTARPRRAYPEPSAQLMPNLVCVSNVTNSRLKKSTAKGSRRMHFMIDTHSDTSNISQ